MRSGSARRSAARRAARARPARSGVSADIGRRITRIRKSKPGYVYTPFDFLDLGSPHSVGMALLRLVRAGELKHLARGLYAVPRQHPVLGELLAAPDDIAAALARRDGATVLPAGAMAANLLGLSTQVPAQVLYLTDGPSRKAKIGSLTVMLRRRPLRQVGSASAMSSLVFAALRDLGKQHVTRERVAHLRTTLSTKDRRRLIAELRLAPAWMHPYLRFIAGDQA